MQSDMKQLNLDRRVERKKKNPLDNPWRLKLFQILRYSMIHPQHRHFILNALKNISTPKMKLMQIASFFLFGKGNMPETNWEPHI